MRTHYIRREGFHGAVTADCNRRGVPIDGKPGVYKALVENPNTMMLASFWLEDVDCVKCIKISLA